MGRIFMSRFLSVILADDMGTGMKSEKSRMLREVCSKPLVKWVREAAEKAGSEKIVTVVGHKNEDVIKNLSEDKLYAVKSERPGTGHAVMAARKYLEGFDGTVVILNGDMPLVAAETVRRAVEIHNKNKSSVTCITAAPGNAFGCGRIACGENGELPKLTDRRDADGDQREIKETNPGMYCFNCEDLLWALSEIVSGNSENEGTLADAAEILKKAGKKSETLPLCSAEEILSINDPIALAAAQKIKQRQIINKHMSNGVIFIDPEHTYVDPEVEIGADSVIYPATFLRGSAKISSNCIIGPSSTVENSEIGSGTEVVNSVVTDSKIGENTSVGPFAYVRPNSSIGSEVKIGDFVEIKNSTIGNGTKVSHLTYVGDSDVGCGVNFGCGTVTVNYDGLNKHRTSIGDNAFIGCNTNLVAPVNVESNAYIAAGSTITDDVEAFSLAIARARQVEKKNWAKDAGWNTKNNKK